MPCGCKKVCGIMLQQTYVNYFGSWVKAVTFEISLNNFSLRKQLSILFIYQCNSLAKNKLRVMYIYVHIYHLHKKNRLQHHIYRIFYDLWMHNEILILLHILDGILTYPWIASQLWSILIAFSGNLKPCVICKYNDSHLFSLML